MYLVSATPTKLRQFNQYKLDLWVTSLSDTPRLQYYDVQTLDYRYISKLIISPSTGMSVFH
jgi:hypothetical protein